MSVDKITSPRDATTPVRYITSPLGTTTPLRAWGIMSDSKEKNEDGMENRNGDEQSQSSDNKSIMNLGNLMYKEGLINGRYSDVTIRTLGTEYKLHRLVLISSPFFENFVWCRLEPMR